jgi:DNA-binding LacI/PurR family transcriptional regulator
MNRPLVLVDFNNDRFALNADQVYFDPLPGYRLAIAHLAARGARRIHFVGGLLRKPAESFEAFLSGGESRFDPQRARIDPDSLLRLSAFRQAMAELGLPAPETCIHYAWPDKQHLRSKAEELARLDLAERPEAVVCHSVEIFAEAGLRLAGAGAASEGYLGSALPVFASGQAMGRTAASLLVWKLQQPERVPLRVGVPMRFTDNNHLS